MTFCRRSETRGAAGQDKQKREELEWWEGGGGEVSRRQGATESGARRWGKMGIMGAGGRRENASVVVRGAGEEVGGGERCYSEESRGKLGYT